MRRIRTRKRERERGRDHTKHDMFHSEAFSIRVARMVFRAYLSAHRTFRVVDKTKSAYAESLDSGPMWGLAAIPLAPKVQGT